ncbi:MAG TPA: hypothetical protein VJ372_06405 [Pyrinomonadaceae bacterium]|nr:hypothetical protein [Pyrinomonadaceae bacterium]
MDEIDEINRQLQEKKEQGYTIEQLYYHWQYLMHKLNKKAKPELGQTKKGSLFEAVMNIVVGIGVALATQEIVFPWFGIHIPQSAHMMRS